MARALKMGSGYDGSPIHKCLLKFLPDKAAPIKLDRWGVHVTHAAGAAVNDELADKVHAESSPTLPQGVFNNYMGVGTDALIALRFHLMREKNPENFNSRLKNKAYYGVLGAKDVLGRPLKNLAKDLELVCDGKSYTEVLRQKKIESLTFLNISSFMAGKKVWGTKHAVHNSDNSIRFVEPSQNDGKFEVIGMTGVTMAKIHSGAGHAIRICQCSTAELTTKRSLPFQQDGEGCMLQGPSVVHVSLKNQATVLCTAKGRYKDLLGTDYEFDTKYRLVNLYYVPVNSQNRSTTIEHVRSVMMPLNATLAEVRLTAAAVPPVYFSSRRQKLVF